MNERPIRALLVVFGLCVMFMGASIAFGTSGLLKIVAFPYGLILVVAGIGACLVGTMDWAPKAPLVDPPSA